MSPRRTPSVAQWGDYRIVTLIGRPEPRVYEDTGGRLEPGVEGAVLRRLCLLWQLLEARARAEKAGR